MLQWHEIFYKAKNEKLPKQKVKRKESIEKFISSLSHPTLKTAWQNKLFTN